MENNLFDFEAEFKLDIEQVDREHITLVNMLNQVYTLLRETKSAEARQLFSQTLSAYVYEHFSNEEKFMEQIGFPMLNDHKKIHANFFKSFHELLPSIESGDDAAFRRALNDTFTWIISHIGGTDRKYADFYHSQSRSTPGAKRI